MDPWKGTEGNRAQSCRFLLPFCAKPQTRPRSHIRFIRKAGGRGGPPSLQGPPPGERRKLPPHRLVASEGEAPPPGQAHGHIAGSWIGALQVLHPAVLQSRIKSLSSEAARANTKVPPPPPPPMPALSKCPKLVPAVQARTEQQDPCPAFLHSPNGDAASCIARNLSRATAQSTATGRSVARERGKAALR